ncbi:MAG: ADP-forming succinate--CoA ligase subunit beta [Dehalococcoidia bacterium]|nr:ADP-forming succinate--CoA ligase subunit beta [Dehalococcoidia bacterium]
MKAHEYQAKEILRQFGVPAPRGRLAETPEDAARVAAEIGGPVAVKAQVHAGGRGKAGGIRLASGPQEAERIAREMLGMCLVTHQTGPQGVTVRKLLVEEASRIDRELYLGMVIDRAAERAVMMASEAGGIDIEEVAAHSPEKILKVYVDPATGFRPFMGRRLAYGLHLDGALAKPAGDLMASLYRAFVEKDCSLAEINPLVVTGDGRLLALDAKLNFDDNALYRHPELVAMRDTAEEAPLEVEASRYGITYIKLDGNIGCMVNGAGLAMATMDVIKLAGGEPANFLDVGGGASSSQVSNALRILMADAQVRAVLINIFGGITRCDVVAQGILEAAKEVQIKAPVVIRLAGTRVKEGMELLSSSGLPFTLATDLADGARKAVAAAG